MQNKPIIGIVLDYVHTKIKDGGYADLPWYALRKNYADMLAEMGCVPVFLHYDQSLINEYIQICSGFLLPGGDFDIHPKFYNEEINPNSVIGTDERVKFEIELINQVISKNKALLGICAGQQSLNVALGGSLFQHIPDSFQTQINHKDPNKKASLSHLLKPVAGSFYAKIVGENEFMINSNHHQAVNKLGKDLAICGYSEDGVIEAIEHKFAKFCIGVVWHPEYLQTPQDELLIKAFVNAAKS
jgi:putative glutamine amidotransferase